MPTSRRLKAFRIHPDTIVSLLTGDAVPVPFPADSQIVRFHTQWETDSPVMIVSSETFPEIKDGELIPIEDLWMKSIRPINVADIEALHVKLATGLVKNDCLHPGAVSRDPWGVYFLNCKECGLYCMTNEAGARTLGWIE